MTQSELCGICVLLFVPTYISPPPSISLSHCIPVSLSLTLSLSHSSSHTLILSLTLSVSHILFSLTHTHSPILSLSLSFSLINYCTVITTSPIFAICSYHQKHYLRLQEDILQELNLSNKELLKSNIAARLNGYCGGYSDLKSFKEEAASFNITSSAQEQIHELIIKGPGTDDD